MPVAASGDQRELPRDGRRTGRMRTRSAENRRRGSMSDPPGNRRTPSAAISVPKARHASSARCVGSRSGCASPRRRTGQALGVVREIEDSQGRLARPVWRGEQPSSWSARGRANPIRTVRNTVCTGTPRGTAPDPDAFGRRHPMPATRHESAPRIRPHPTRRIDCTSIAGLTKDAISNMTDAELARIVRSAHLGCLSTDSRAHVGLKDRTTLERLTYLARRCCRNQLEQGPAIPEVQATESSVNPPAQTDSRRPVRPRR